MRKKNEEKELETINIATMTIESEGGKKGEWNHERRKKKEKEEEERNKGGKERYNHNIYRLIWGHQ